MIHIPPDLCSLNSIHDLQEPARQLMPLFVNIIQIYSHETKNKLGVCKGIFFILVDIFLQLNTSFTLMYDY